MKILFLENHPMWIYGLPLGFKDIGMDVLTSPVISEESLRDTVFNYKPDLVFSLGWTEEHSVEKQAWVKKYLESANIPHAYWATEDPTHTETFTLPFVNYSKIDYIFTICSAKVEYYQKLGLKAFHLDFAYHPRTNCRTNVEGRYAKQLAVVANAYPEILGRYPGHYRVASMKNLLIPLIKENVRVDFWGRGWNHMAGVLGEPVPLEWLHGYLDYLETNKVYSSADIIIGLQNHRTQVTQRTYEILGAEGFLLTSDTPEIRRLFQPGRDLVVSSSAEETIDLVRYYLKKPAEREKISRQGKETVEKYHTYKHRASYIMNLLKQEGIG